MAGQGKLFKLFSSLGNYRNLLSSRLTVAPSYLQNAGLKMETKDKLKSLKIPDHPKRPLSPYFRFLAEQRPLVHKEHPEWKLIDVTKKCAQDWKNVNASIKEKYQNEYNNEIAEYDKKNKQYKSSLTPEQSKALDAARMEKKKSKQKRVLKKRFRETGKPKRHTSSFLFFIKEQWALPENKDKKLQDMLSSYKDKWNGMSDTEKEKYKKMQDDDRERYKKEIALWEAQMVKEGHTDLIRKDSQFIELSKPLHIESSKEKKVR